MPVWILPGKWHLLYHLKSNKAHHKTAAKYLAISHVRELCIRQQQQHIPISVIQHSLRISCFLLSLVCLELYAFIPSMSIGLICFYNRTIRRFPDIPQKSMEQISLKSYICSIFYLYLHRYCAAITASTPQIILRTT